MGHSITIVLPDEVYQRVRSLAKQSQKDVVALVTEKVVDSFAGYTFPADPDRPKMLKERAAYEILHPSLVSDYLGQYVAIFQGELVDSDQDVTQLNERVRTKFPDAVILITKVEAEPIRTLYFRSPCLEQFSRHFGWAGARG